MDCACSPGCENCYVERPPICYSLPRHTTFYPEKLEKLAKLDFGPQGEPFRRGPASRAIAFPCDLGDLFHIRVLDREIYDAFRAMQDRPDVDFVIVTKRAERMWMWAARVWPGRWPANIWPAVTVCTQREAYHKLPYLYQIDAAVRIANLEPLLGLVHLQGACTACRTVHCIETEACVEHWPQGTIARPDWVWAGAESGPDRRPFEVAWAQVLYETCKPLGIPLFLKQGSGVRPGTPLVLPGIGQVHMFPGQQYE